jgi:homoserine dehydrogenase
LNGTCAYILSRMQSEGKSFGEALGKPRPPATRRPIRPRTSDGADAAAKLAIIAAVGLRRPVRVGDIATRSIRAD